MIVPTFWEAKSPNPCSIIKLLLSNKCCPRHLNTLQETGVTSFSYPVGIVSRLNLLNLIQLKYRHQNNINLSFTVVSKLVPKKNQFFFFTG